MLRFLGKVLFVAFTVSSVLFVSAPASASQELDAKYFTLGSMQIEEVTPPSYLRTEDSLCEPSVKPKVGGGEVNPNFDGINLDQIINMGQKIWTIIEKNKPVVNLKVQKADAVPEGIQSWGELECWQVPESRVYRVTYKNLYGITVVDLGLRVSYTYGGRYNGLGRYLSQVTVQPAQLDVAWGYKIDAQVNVVNVTNAGSRSNPVAGIQMDVNWVITTPLKYSESTESFYVRGDGLLKQLQ